MVTWMLYILALIAIVTVLTLVFGKIMGRGEIMPELVDHESIVALNRAAVQAHDYGRVRFDTVVRGYRQEQVDAVIVQLTQEIAELRKVAESKTAAHPVVSAQE